jgi:antitoxin (DNA-binding transcriptional repressor) of toxin-antitoxin stability system
MGFIEGNRPRALSIRASPGTSLGKQMTKDGHVMKTVNISDLKAQLSAHIQLVKDSEEVLVCDRNKPVARIVPCRLQGLSEQEQRLVARGVLTPPLKKRPAAVSWPEPPGNVSDEVIERVWREERESR